MQINFLALAFQWYPSSTQKYQHMFSLCGNFINLFTLIKNATIITLSYMLMRNVTHRMELTAWTYYEAQSYKFLEITVNSTDQTHNLILISHLLLSQNWLIVRRDIRKKNSPWYQCKDQHLKCFPFLTNGPLFEGSGIMKRFFILQLENHSKSEYFFRTYTTQFTLTTFCLFF